MRVANFRVCVCWLAVCHAAQMPFMLTDNVPHLLSDGLLITRASDIHVRRGTYTVLVVIDAPRSEPRMDECLNELGLVIEKLGTIRTIRVRLEMFESSASATWRLR